MTILCFKSLLNSLYLQIEISVPKVGTCLQGPRHFGLLFHCSLSLATPLHASATGTSPCRVVSELCACDHMVVSAWQVFLPFSTYLVLPFPSNSPQIPPLQSLSNSFTQLTTSSPVLPWYHHLYHQLAYYKLKKKIYSLISLLIRTSFDILAWYPCGEGAPYMLKQRNHLSNGSFVDTMTFS